MNQMTEFVRVRVTPELKARLQEIADKQSGLAGLVRISDVLRVAAAEYVEKWDKVD